MAEVIEFVLMLEPTHQSLFTRLAVFMCNDCGALVCEDQKQVHEEWHRSAYEKVQ